MSLTIVKALWAATQKYPYYARGFAAMTPVEKIIDVGGGPTLGVDKYWRLYYSKEALTKYQFNLADVICHELEHLVRDHASRCKSRDFRAWNIAADAEINDDLDDLPESAVFPEDLECETGKTAEYYYSQLPAIDIKKIKSFGNGSEKGTEGSGVTGKAEFWEIDGDSSKVPSVKEGEVETLKDAIASDIQRASKIRSNVHKSALVWAEARAKGKLPKRSWKVTVGKKLRNIVRGRQDWTFARPSRRQDRGDKFLLPGMVAYRPSVVVVIDTSGSMHNEVDWIAGILKDVAAKKADVTIVDCDSEVAGIRKLTKWQDVLKSRGGGGTDMTVGIRKAQGLKPDLILVLTDGYTPWPSVWPKNCIALIKEEKSVRVKKSA